jgi:dTMP kinase
LVLGSSYGSIPLGAGLFALVAWLCGGLGGRLELAPVFWIDAASFVFSFMMIRRIRLGPERHHTAHEHHVGFAEAFRIPLVRSVIVPTVSAAVGIGVLFSLGITFVRDTLGASNAQFAVLIGLFGIGAAIGLVALQRLDVPDAVAVYVAVGMQGATVAIMSLAPTVELADLGAILFGASTAAALAAGMSLVQRGLSGEDRVLAFTAFHVLIRIGLSLAAVGAGIAADLLGGVDWPLVGSLDATRVVLLCSGLVVLGCSVAFARLRNTGTIRHAMEQSHT